jgi:hypothetical protein
VNVAQKSYSNWTIVVLRKNYFWGYG